MYFKAAFFSFLALKSTSATTTNKTSDFAAPCYLTPLPSIPTNSSLNNITRSIPWATPSLTLSNGSTCCTSLTQVRSGIDAVDAQILSLLAKRAGYVREATRFKATLGSVDVPSRDDEVIDGAVVIGRSIGVPEVLSRAVFEGVIQGGVRFERCVWAEYGGCEGGM